ncbi:hypothetical protein RFI_22357 [Reticulomyxa filosa]|uniref:Uncharacterized protein n=1 Tax=Reticulomyxa filosa TaxID=46433 RepID=X6MMX7_RETFI|nr:hypothetical protein RFI_22357 [Reticulomyxa filosa]|eukprot:ETO15011.1 hypothetical protein RFI_22357 [Reticulomyxa filosa]
MMDARTSRGSNNNNNKKELLGKRKKNIVIGKKKYSCQPKSLFSLSSIPSSLSLSSLGLSLLERRLYYYLQNHTWFANVMTPPQCILNSVNYLALTMTCPSFEKLLFVNIIVRGTNGGIPCQWTAVVSTALPHISACEEEQGQQEKGVHVQQKRMESLERYSKSTLTCKDTNLTVLIVAMTLKEFDTITCNFNGYEQKNDDETQAHILISTQSGKLVTINSWTNELILSIGAIK